MKKDDEKKFSRLKEDDELVKKLQSADWWDKIVKLSHEDPDINIQLRSNSINVYSKMGNLLKICLKRGDICCEIHYKYLIGNANSEYVKMSPDGDRLKVPDNACPNVSYILEPGCLKTIKQNIAVYAGEEKGIQSRIVEKNKETIVDVEVAFSERTKDNNTRIDFVNLDKKSKKLVFVELKQVFDKRLYNPEKNPEINEQIGKYYEFACDHEKEIIQAYQETIKTKRKLGIIKKQSFLADVNINDIKLEKRPLLIVAGYNQPVINALSEKIMSNITVTDHLSGLFFFGKDVDLNLSEQGGNKILY